MIEIGERDGIRTVELAGTAVEFDLGSEEAAEWFNRVGVYERAPTGFLLDHLRGKDVFIDVGAFIGWYTCIAGKAIGPGKVFAFEPNPVTRAELERNVRLNALDNVCLLPVAVGDAPGEVRFDAGWKAGLVLGSGPDVAHIVTLDDFFSGVSLANAVIKIDVEGWESKVVAGGVEKLGRDRPELFVEMHPHKTSIDAAWSVAETLREMGYIVREFLDHAVDRHSEELFGEYTYRRAGARTMIHAS